EREISPQSAQSLVPQPRGGDDERRLRGELPPEAAATLLHRVASFRLLAGLPLSCAAARYALQSDRHGALQIRRIQAERSHQSEQECGLLEEGTPVSRRHRVYDYQEPIDRGHGIRCRQGGFYFPFFLADPGLKGSEEPGVRRDLRADADERQPQRNVQSRGITLQQPRTSPRRGAQRRPQ